MQERRDGFGTAAETVEDSNLRHLLESYAQQRAEFAADLQLEVRRLVEGPVNTGHAAPALQRAWPDTKVGLAKRDEATVIAECEQGEDAAVRAYQKSWIRTCRATSE